MPYKDPVRRKEYAANHYAKNNIIRKEQQVEYYQNIRQYGINSIISGENNDIKKWDLFCNIIKSSAKKNKQSYSVDFTNTMLYEMLTMGCFFCGDTATTIDRINSSTGHTVNNCVGCCFECNISKGSSDPMTFIRKAYYRARREYADDITDIWFINKQKPRMDHYKRRADKQGVPFELTKDDFCRLIKGDCEYCQRTPTTWFGIDRVIPGEGYTTDNVVSCCFDCNLDKHINDVRTMLTRNKQIADRVDNEKIIMSDCLRVILHKGKLRQAKKVCVYGTLYENKSDASRILGKYDYFVGDCIKNDRYLNDIFEITDEFYEKYKDCENITLEMYENFTS